MKFKLIILSILLSQFAFSQDFKFGKVSKAELQEKQHPLDPSAHAAILYREQKTQFIYNSNDGFITQTKVFERIKIYDKEGYDWATKAIKLYQGKSGSKVSISGLKGNTYFIQNGKIEKVKLKNDGIFDERASKYNKIKKFTLPNLSEGCVIEYEYTLSSPFINQIKEYRLQESIPVNKVLASFYAPEYFMYKSHKKGYIPFTINQSFENKKFNYKYNNSAQDGHVYRQNTSEVTYRENRYKVILNKVPALKEEAYAGNINNYITSINFELAYTKYPNSPGKNFTKSWNDVSNTIYESSSFGLELEKNNYFKKDIDALLNGVDDVNEKLIKIFNFVKSKTTWNKYIGYVTDQGVKQAYKNGKGSVAEINLMLTSMLRYAGLNANPILVSTRNNGFPVYPTTNGFNYVISGVEVTNNVLLLDACYKESEINILNSNIINGQGRIIRKDGSSNWVPLTPKKHANRNTMVTATIKTDDLNILGTSQTRFSGYFAKEIRSNYQNLNVLDIAKKMENNFSGTKIKNPTFSDLKTLYKPISLKYDFVSEGAIEKINGKLYLSPMLFLAKNKSPFTLEERKYPIDYEYKRKIRNIINIVIPEGYEVETLPKNTSFGFGNKLGTFKYNITKNNGKLQISTEFAINQSFIDASEYKNLKGFYKLMIEKQNEKVVLKKI
ncbi:MAG: DUF3858 domain-containing protein [Flavobacteriales bacterium]